MPLYGVNNYAFQSESGGQAISYYPVYQGFMDPAFVNGIQCPFYTQRDAFYKVWTPYVQSLESIPGNGTPGPYSMSLPFFPALSGHVDISGIMAVGSKVDPIVGSSLNVNVPYTSLTYRVSINATGLQNQQMSVVDSGQFDADNQQIGFLQTSSGTSIQAAGTVNYITGDVSVTFPADVMDGTAIQINCYFYEPGFPRAMLFYNNVIEILPPPNVSYTIEMDAYLTPAAFMVSSASIQFGYMTEYLARGAARKIFMDTGDMELFQINEPMFKEQETLVWKRSQRQFTSTRTGTIFSDLQSQNTSNSYGIGSL